MRASLLLPVALALAVPAAADSGRLMLFASGEDLATGGFQAPRLTRDGWALSFERIIATFADITAYQTEPPFMADGPTITGLQALPVAGSFTVDLVLADEDDRVAIANLEAPAGHYNALAWSLAPAPAGEFRGYSLVLAGTATRDGTVVPFVLATRDRHRYACGEYVGDERKGFVTAGGVADLEMTLHLDHLFGRADKPADDPINTGALGFDAFAAGGLQEFSLAGLHLGHVGEGHCHVTSE